MSKKEKTKSELEAELKKLNELERKIQDKKEKLHYKKTNVPFKVGTSYLLRTVTYFSLGRVKAIVGQFLVFEDFSWVADTGRFTQAINEGQLNEVEPVDGDVFVNMASVVDAFIWRHKLPREQK